MKGAQREEEGPGLLEAPDFFYQTTGESGRKEAHDAHTRSPKPDLAPRGEEAALYRQDCGADSGDQSLDLLSRGSYAHRGQDGPTPSDEPGRQTPATPFPLMHYSLSPDARRQDCESSYREVKETLSVTGSP
jgi:hypothetical protein